jgi:hypothetical protein
LTAALTWPRSRLVARGIDDDATLGCGSGDGEKALPQRLVEAPVHPLIAILGPAPRGGTAEALLDRQVEDQGQRRLEPVDHRGAEGCDEAAVETLAIALIGHG